MPNHPVPLVKIDRIALVDPLKNLRKWLPFRLNQQMNMIAHQHISIQNVIKLNLVVRKNLEIPLIVISIFKYSLL